VGGLVGAVCVWRGGWAAGAEQSWPVVVDRAGSTRTVGVALAYIRPDQLQPALVVASCLWAIAYGYWVVGAG
jgi:hypothetical protein